MDLDFGVKRFNPYRTTGGKSEERLPTCKVAGVSAHYPQLAPISAPEAELTPKIARSIPIYECGRSLSQEPARHKSKTELIENTYKDQLINTQENLVLNGTRQIVSPRESDRFCNTFE